MDGGYRTHRPAAARGTKTRPRQETRQKPSVGGSTMIAFNATDRRRRHRVVAFLVVAGRTCVGAKCKSFSLILGTYWPSAATRRNMYAVGVS